MKMMKAARKLTAVALIAVMTLVTLCFTACTESKDKIVGNADVSASERVLEKFFGNERTVTITDDEEYYSQTVYFRNEEDFCAERNKSSANGLNAKAKVNSGALPKKTDGKFVIGARKRVWVEEVYYGGETVGSRLLRSEEIESNNVSTYGYLGDASESKFSLDIDMYVIYEPREEYYYVAGNAYWNSQAVTNSEKNPENSSDDFMGLTWGGDGELKVVDRSFEGEYRDGTAISASTKISDTYAGYCWQFREKTGFWGSAMRDATCDVVLKKTYQELKYKETNAKFTYIHTYNNIKPSVSISLSGNGLAGSIILSQDKNTWQMQIDVPALIY